MKEKKDEMPLARVDGCTQIAEQSELPRHATGPSELAYEEFFAACKEYVCLYLRNEESDGWLEFMSAAIQKLEASQPKAGD